MKETYAKIPRVEKDDSSEAAKPSVMASDGPADGPKAADAAAASAPASAKSPEEALEQLKAEGVSLEAVRELLAKHTIE
jgi:hypothetical protein